MNQADHIIVMSEGRMVRRAPTTISCRDRGELQGADGIVPRRGRRGTAAANVQPPHPAAATGATAAVEEVVVEEAPDEGRSAS